MAADGLGTGRRYLKRLEFNAWAPIQLDLIMPSIFRTQSVKIILIKRNLHFVWR